MQPLAGCQPDLRTVHLLRRSFVTMLCSMEFGVFLFFAGWVIIMVNALLLILHQ
jgi:hypothetical protein